MFAPALSVVGGPPSLGAIPVQGAGGAKLPGGWSTLDQTVVDVSSILGTDGHPLESHLCGSPADPNTGVGAIPKGSAAGKILLVSRGVCTFVSKAERAQLAGAIGIILVDNRFGEANAIPIRLPIPAAMISDLDGEHLRGYLAANGGQARIRVTGDIQEIQTGRSGVITSFSSAGPTDFGHLLKPDISAPGLDVLSSTPPATTGETFSVFAGTSMATPHVAGAAALLLQRHPSWTAWNVKSALMSTAGPAWGNTARTQEAPVLLEGSGLTDVASRRRPEGVHRPAVAVVPEDRRVGERTAQLDAPDGDRRRRRRGQLDGGARRAGADGRRRDRRARHRVDHTRRRRRDPGRRARGCRCGRRRELRLRDAHRRRRRAPRSLRVPRRAPGAARPSRGQAAKLQTGDTAAGPSRVSVYCCPLEPFGPPPDYTGQPMNEDGSEHLYYTDVNQPIVNLGVSILASSPGALIDPFVLGSKDENDVQGYAGIPTDVNALTYDLNVDVGAAGVQFPRLQRFYVAVDSRADPFTNKSQKGKYLLNSWVDDLTPPAVRMLTTRVTAGRPLLVAQAVDNQAGVDPLSLVVNYSSALVGASAYDPSTGIVVFGLPSAAPALKAGKTNAIVEASDYQEAKNINTIGNDLYPNTNFKQSKLTVVNGPTVTWLEPPARVCALKNDRLLVVGDSTKKVKQVVFTDGTRRSASTRKAPAASTPSRGRRRR